MILHVPTINIFKQKGLTIKIIYNITLFSLQFIFYTFHRYFASFLVECNIRNIFIKQNTLCHFQLFVLHFKENAKKKWLLN